MQYRQNPRQEYRVRRESVILRMGSPVCRGYSVVAPAAGQVLPMPAKLGPHWADRLDRCDLPEVGQTRPTSVEQLQSRLSLTQIGLVLPRIGQIYQVLTSVVRIWQKSANTLLTQVGQDLPSKRSQIWEI